MDLDDIFLKSYLSTVNDNEKRKILISQEDRKIAERKKQQLAVIEQFLQKFVDLEVLVNHSDQYTKTTRTMEGIEPQKFAFYHVDSSKTWAPGVSIWLDHPATIEIAIPNKPQDDGVVVIRVASTHPDAYILEQKFNNFEAACVALGSFLGKCTVSIGQDPQKYIKEVAQKKQPLTNTVPENTFFNNVPEYPPVEEPSYKKHASNKEGESGISIKKISEFFNIKSKNLDDEEE